MTKLSPTASSGLKPSTFEQKAPLPSPILVFIQFTLLTLLVFTGPILPLNLPAFLALTAGSFLGFWAVVAMRSSILRITPEVAIGAQLITTGPYRWIRHPMYTAVLLVALALFLNYPTLLRFLYFLGIIIDLHLKLSYEEMLLSKRFPDYHSYRQRTKQLLPFLY